MTVNASITARQLVGVANLWPLESSRSGLDFCWTGANPEFQFSFLVDRGRALRLQIRLFSLIKASFAEDLCIFIDAQPVPHKVSKSGELTVLRCALPPHDRADPTRLKIVLPATHSPSDLGLGPDTRELGIAIVDVRIFSPFELIDRLVSKLRGRPIRAESPLQLNSMPQLNSATTPGTQSIRAMNSHLRPDNLLVEIDEEVKRRKARSPVD